MTVIANMAGNGRTNSVWSWVHSVSSYRDEACMDIVCMEQSVCLLFPDHNLRMRSINICMWSSPVPMQCVPRTMYVHGQWHVSEEESPPNQDPILSLPSRCCPWKAPILSSTPSTPSVSCMWLYAYHYYVHILTQLGTDISSVMSMEVATGAWPKSW